MLFIYRIEFREHLYNYTLQIYSLLILFRLKLGMSKIVKIFAR